MRSDQTLDEADRRLLAQWAADCAGRVIGLVHGTEECEATVADALERTRAYGLGSSTSVGEIRKRMLAVKAAGLAEGKAGAAAARSVAQASAVAHMGAHALGAAAYAARAVDLADDGRAAGDELSWQVAHLTDEQREALRRLPEVGAPATGPLGPGLLSRGQLGETIRAIQEAVREG